MWPQGYVFILDPNTSQKTMNERTELVAFEIAIVIDIPIRGTAVMVQIPEGTHDAALTYT